MINKGLMTSNKDDWETPQWLFNELNEEFNFVLDVCCTMENCKCLDGFSKEHDGLSQDWSTPDGWKWMNPPYGDPENPCKKTAKRKNV